MRVNRWVAALSVAVGLAVQPGEVRAAEAVSCVDAYLLCINVASQESGWGARTAKEFECGADYYACMRKKLVGA